jgi:hypothetical protein
MQTLSLDIRWLYIFFIEMTTTPQYDEPNEELKLEAK